MIKVIRDIGGFELLRPAWGALIAKNTKALVFQTYDWNYSVWQRIENGKELFLLDATRDGHQEEHVIFPFCKDSRGVIAFIGSSVADVLDAIYSDHENDWHILYAEVARFIEGNSEIKGVKLSKIHGECEIARYFPVYMKNISLVRMDSHSAIVWKKAEEPTQVMYNLNSKERSYIRSLLKYSGHEIVISSNNSGGRFPRDKVLSLRAWMIENGWRDKRSLPITYFDLMEDMYNLGLCEVSLALNKENGDCNLVAFRLLYRQRTVFWLVMYNIAKLVTICDARYISSKLKCSDMYFDWGTGAYSYKLGTFRPDIHNLYSLESRQLTLKNWLMDMKSLARKYIRAWAISAGLKKDRFHPMMCKRESNAK